MKLSQLRSRCRPHLWYQLYWVVYLIWFFWLDLTVTAPKYIIHSPLDDLIPFNEWFEAVTRGFTEEEKAQTGALLERLAGNARDYIQAMQDKGERPERARHEEE